MVRLGEAPQDRLGDDRGTRYPIRYRRPPQGDHANAERDRAAKVAARCPASQEKVYEKAHEKAPEKS
jgi:hypothetical protein